MPCPYASPNCNGPTGMGFTCMRCKRGAGAFQPMQKTNTGAGPSRRGLRLNMTAMDGSVNINGTEFAANSNCALATAAGICNLAAQSVVATTGSIAQQLGRTDNRMAFLPNGGGTPQQAAGIKAYCDNHPSIQGRYGTRIESGVGSKAEGLQLMSNAPLGTLFAICISGRVPGLGFRSNDRDAGLNADLGPASTHWLVACREATGVVFYDFQPDWQPTNNSIPSARDVVRNNTPTCLGHAFAPGYSFNYIIIFLPAPAWPPQNPQAGNQNSNQ